MSEHYDHSQTMKEIQITQILICGAGPVGLSLGIGLKKLFQQKNRDLQITIIEKRPDPRTQKSPAGRSINLILTAKGRHCFHSLGILNKIKKITTPVFARYLHQQDGTTHYQPYGQQTIPTQQQENNWSISRQELTNLLLNEANSLHIPIQFNTSLESIDYVDKNKQYKNQNPIYHTAKISTSSQNEKIPNSITREIKFSLLFGADGIHSTVRKQTFLSEQEIYRPLGMSYKEIYISKNSLLDTSCLHIWPRGHHMLMALPNLDGSFTATLYRSDDEMADVHNEEVQRGSQDKPQEKDFQIVQKYFQDFYPDALPLIPQVHEQYFQHPTGQLGDLECESWVYKNTTALLGDAAHAIVPFFGQGLNCGLNDVENLCHLISTDSTLFGSPLQSVQSFPSFQSFEKIFQDYEQLQKPKAKAIRQMSLENFSVMTQKVSDRKYNQLKKLEHQLEKDFPKQFRSQYALVTYTMIDYDHCQKIGQLNHEILEHLLPTTLFEQESLHYNKKTAQDFISNKISSYFRTHNLEQKLYSF